MVSIPPCCFAPGKKPPVFIGKETGWTPEQIWWFGEKSYLCWESNPGHPALSLSLHPLHYPDFSYWTNTNINKIHMKLSEYTPIAVVNGTVLYMRSGNEVWGWRQTNLTKDVNACPQSLQGNVEVRTVSQIMSWLFPSYPFQFIVQWSFIQSRFMWSEILKGSLSKLRMKWIIWIRWIVP